jgi:maleylacetate reductase
LIATPTTYSGAEFAPNWYIGVGPKAKRGTGEAALPRVVIYDCELALGLPIMVAAASGMNAMAHTVESLYGPDRNPLIEAVAEEAVRKLNVALPHIVANPSNIDARSDAMVGAWLAAAYRAKTSLEHALAQFLRHMFDLNHAETHAVVLPYVVAFNRDYIEDSDIRLRRALGTDEPARALYQLNRRLGLKTGLRDIGMTEAQVATAVKEFSKQNLNNPRPVNVSDIENIIRLAYTGAEPSTI